MSTCRLDEIDDGTRRCGAQTAYRGLATSLALAMARIFRATCSPPPDDWPRVRGVGERAVGLCVGGSVYERIGGGKLLLAITVMCVPRRGGHARALPQSLEAAVKGMLGCANSRAVSRDAAMFLMERVSLYRICASMIHTYEVRASSSVLTRTIRSIFAFERKILFQCCNDQYIGAVYSKSLDWFRVPDDLDPTLLPSLDKILTCFVEAACKITRSTIQTGSSPAADEIRELLDLLHDVSLRRLDAYHEESASAALYWLHRLSPISSTEQRGLPSIQSLWIKNVDTERRECDLSQSIFIV